MKLHKLVKPNTNSSQRGFTLVEVMVALAVNAIIAGVITMSIFQIFTVNLTSNAHMTAIKEVENANYWISNDARMAQIANTNSASGFPLTLTWIDWSGNSASATYDIVNSQLKRTYSENGGPPTDTLIASHIDSNQTNCSITSDTFSFKITSAVDDSYREIETRTFNIIPRCAPVTINHNSALTVVTNSLPPDQTGIVYSQVLSAAGGTAPYTWSLTAGALPAGLTLSSGGTISGTPTTVGTCTFTVRVSDSTIPVQNTAYQALSIYVSAALSLNTTSVPDGPLGTAYSQTLSASGGSVPYTWSLASGSLPAGLTLSSGGIISGTPTSTGTSSFTVRVTDSYSPTHNVVNQALSITIYSPLSITTTSLPNGTVGSAYSQTLAASGGATPYSWSLSSGSLPAGLSLSSGGSITGAPVSAGTSNFTVQATDSANPTQNTATKALSITINYNFSITTASLPDGNVGTAYSQTLNASGGVVPYTWSISAGSLPAGLTLSSAGVISGTPTTGGTSNFTVRVTDNASPSHNTTTKALSITITSTTTVTLYPTKDTYVLSYSTGANTNYENQGYIRVGYYFGSGSDNYRTLVQFDLSSLAGKTIDSASLKLNCQAEDYGSTITTNVYRITGSWTAGSVTWNTQPSINSTVLAANSTGGTGWKTWDLKTAIQAIANGTYTNYGWMLKSPSSNTRDTFTDNSSGGTSTGPQLVITYH
jgi:prepilin-type N-terminal cleavage/methylation domain-containing protein